MLSSSVFHYLELSPRAALLQLHTERHSERGAVVRAYALHNTAHTSAQRGRVFGRNLEEQLIVDLKEKATGGAAAAVRGRIERRELTIEVEHGLLDEVGGRALHDRVDGLSLGGASELGLLGADADPRAW